MLLLPQSLLELEIQGQYLDTNIDDMHECYAILVEKEGPNLIYKISIYAYIKLFIQNEKSNIISPLLNLYIVFACMHLCTYIWTYISMCSNI